MSNRSKIAALMLAGTMMGSGLAAEPELRVLSAASMQAMKAKGMQVDIQRGALRTVHDVTRNRVWVLRHDAVYLYDSITQARLGRIELRGWVYARDAYACAPDLAVDARGAAVISSNVIPTLWRVDADKAVVTVHELRLDADEGRDVGFTALRYAPGHDVFFAASPMHASLWRIDPLLRRAQKVELSAPVPDSCAMAVESNRVRRSVALLLCPDYGTRGWGVELAPDQRSARVLQRTCAQRAGA